MTKTRDAGQAANEKILAFPLSCRRDIIRRSAAALEQVHGEDAVVHWRDACRALAGELQAIGCDEDDIQVQIMDFQTEVQLEMMRRYTERLQAADEDARRSRLGTS